MNTGGNSRNIIFWFDQNLRHFKPQQINIKTLLLGVSYWSFTHAYVEVFLETASTIMDEVQRNVKSSSSFFLYLLISSLDHRQCKKLKEKLSRSTWFLLRIVGADISFRCCRLWIYGKKSNSKKSENFVAVLECRSAVLCAQVKNCRCVINNSINQTIGDSADIDLNIKLKVKNWSRLKMSKTYGLVFIIFLFAFNLSNYFQNLNF